MTKVYVCYFDNHFDGHRSEPVAAFLTWEGAKKWRQEFGVDADFVELEVKD